MTHRRTILAGGGLFSAIVLVSCLTFYFSIGPCPRGSFKCDNGTTCVAQQKMCDKHADCDDGEDEHPFTCGMLYGGQSLALDFYNKLEALPKHNRKCNVYLDGCTRTCHPLPTMFCKGLGLTRLPKVIEDYPVSDADKPIMRIYIPHNRIVLEDDTFANVILEKVDLSYNHLKKIPEKTFVGQQHLRQLSLGDNNIGEIKPGSFSGLSRLEWFFLQDNKLTKFPLEDLANSSDSLVWLNFTNNYLRLDEDGGQSFPQLNRLWDLYLDNNRIEDITRHMFAKLTQLEVLGLNGNRISYIHPMAFEGLLNLRDLRLAHNRLTVLPENCLELNSMLQVLYLNNNPEINVQLSKYGDLPNATFINLAGIDSQQIDFEAINRLPNLFYIIFEKFHYCSWTPSVIHCSPKTDGISSLENLLENPVLRYSAWMMALLTCLGNILVLWVRCTFRDENKNVSTVIRNLAIADLFMGVYLLVISVQDMRYRDVYNKEASGWVGSWTCVASGIVAMVSSEVSLLILAFMSLDRFLVIADPFGGQKTCRRMAGPLVIIWFLGTAISIVPVIYYWSSSKFYGIYASTCFPLHIDRYPVGWQYSAFLFFGVNMFLLIVMLVLYSGLLYSIRRTSRATPLPFKDCEITIRFFFIVLTSASCWVSIIGFKLLAIVGYEFGLDIYAFVMVYLLPLNSAVNPLLYTFTTPHYMQRIVTRHWRNFFKLKCEHHRILTNGNCGSGGRGTNNYYSNQEESQGRIVPSSSFNGGGGKGRSPDESQLEKAVLPSLEAAGATTPGTTSTTNNNNGNKW